MFRPALRLAVLLCLIAASAKAYNLPPSFADMVDKLSPAVVNVSTTQKVKASPNQMLMPFQNLPDTPEFEPFRQFFDQLNRGQGQQQEHEGDSLGSGFIIDATGFIIT